MDQDSPHWCPEHAELFRNNGVSPEAILKQVIASLAKSWQARTGLQMQTDDESVKKVLNTIGNGKPFCCHLGNQKLQAILINISTKVETNKARRS